MKKNGKHSSADTDLGAEYSFTGADAVRGKYADRFPQKPGCFLAAIDLDLRRHFPTDHDINEALHAMIDFQARTRTRHPVKSTISRVRTKK